ncbi:MAG TPA: ABC transporter substrate-binding protein, partial [Actinomycetota bacterium]|nr:ABC transporter substrate-binding protein [Actinomycetota bacterium]
MRAPRFVAVFAILALLAAACGGGGGDNQSGTTSSSITIAIGAEPTTLDPQVRDDGNERAINDNIYETLMARDPAGELQPGLAAAAPTRKGDESWEFKLRPEVKFSNGEAFNADAVVASVERVIDPKFNSEQASFFSTITGATKVDDLTVTIETKGPDPLLPSRMYWMKMVPAKYS